MPNDELSDVAVEILLTLSKGRQHGYAIKLDIEERAGGDYVLGSGSLYQALRRLERRGLLAVDAARAGGGGRSLLIGHRTAGRVIFRVTASMM